MTKNMFRLNQAVVSGLATLALAVGMAFPQISFADQASADAVASDASASGAPSSPGNPADSGKRGKHKRHGRKARKAFRRGVCVGQSLSRQGITLPAPQPGQKPVWDSPTKAAFKAAMKECRKSKPKKNGQSAENANDSSGSADFAELE